MDYPKIEQIEVKAHKIAKCIPWSENCFGCNEALPGGLGVRAYVTEDDYVVGLCTTRPEHTGFPGVTHGGILSTYFDEVLWHATRVQNPGTVAMTVEMTVHYMKPVHPGENLRIVGMPAKSQGRHVYVDGYMLLPDDSVACTARCHYVVVREENSLNEEENSRIRHEQGKKVKSLIF